MQIIFIRYDLNVTDIKRNNKRDHQMVSNMFAHVGKRIFFQAADLRL